MDTPLVYLFFGSPGSGRREILNDLLEFGLENGDRAVVLESSRELESGSEWSASQKVSTFSYEWKDDSLILPEIDASDSDLFLLADGLTDPADFIEFFFNWISESEYELARIFTVVDCQLVARTSKAIVWYDCCIHFSDVVLLNRRDGLSNKVVNDFIDRYRKQYYPCFFEMVKKGRVKNPSLILDPSPRRIARLFDDPEPIDDDDEKEDFSDDELTPGDPSKDPFLKRVASGRRERVLPDMGQLLGNR